MSKKRGKPLADGLTAAELKEVQTLEAHVEQEEAAAAASSPAPKPEPTPEPDPARTESPEAEIARVEKQIAELQAKLHKLQHPYQPWPKMVEGRVYSSQANLDAGKAD